MGRGLSHMPWEPVEQWIRVTYVPDEREQNNVEHDRLPVTVIARLCNVSTQSIHRYKKLGAIPWATADEIAIALGLHPIILWPDEWTRTIGDAA